MLGIVELWSHSSRILQGKYKKICFEVTRVLMNYEIPINFLQKNDSCYIMFLMINLSNYEIPNNFLQKNGLCYIMFLMIKLSHFLNHLENVELFRKFWLLVLLSFIFFLSCHLFRSFREVSSMMLTLLIFY